MRGMTILWKKCNIYQKKKKNHLFYNLFLKLKKKKTKKKESQTLHWLVCHPNGWPVNPYMEPRVAAPPPEHLVVDPRGIPRVVRPPQIGFRGGKPPPTGVLGVAPDTTPGVVAATLGSWWVADHPLPMGFSFFNNLLFFYIKCEIFLVILIGFKLKYMHSYQTKE